MSDVHKWDWMDYTVMVLAFFAGLGISLAIAYMATEMR